MQEGQNGAPPPSYSDQPPAPGSYPPPQQGGSYPPAQPGYQPAPAYGMQQQTTNNTTVVMAGQPTIIQTTVVAPSDCLACSILNLIFCNCLFGAIAVGMSCAARSAFDRGDEVQGRTYVKVATAMNVIGPLATVLAVVIVIVYLGVVLGTLF